MADRLTAEDHQILQDFANSSCLTHRPSLRPPSNFTHSHNDPNPLTSGFFHAAQPAVGNGLSERRALVKSPHPMPGNGQCVQTTKESNR